MVRCSVILMCILKGFLKKKFKKLDLKRCNFWCSLSFWYFWHFSTAGPVSAAPPFRGVFYVYDDKGLRDGARERLGELVTVGGWRGVVSRNCVTLSSVYTSVLVAATLAASRGAALANKSIQFVRRLQSDVDPVYGQHSYARPLAALNYAQFVCRAVSSCISDVSEGKLQALQATCLLGCLFLMQHCGKTVNPLMRTGATSNDMWYTGR